MEKTPKNDSVVNSIFLFLGGTVFMSHVRDYIQLFPEQKKKVIQALKMLIEEIENS